MDNGSDEVEGWIGSGVTTAIEPWLTVPDGRVASDFSSDAFGAVRANRLDDDDGDRSSRSPRSTGGRRL
jgi:hypothetical protein